MIGWLPPEEATGGTHRADDRKSDAAGGEGGGRLMTRTERKQRIQRGNGQTEGVREPSRIREGGKGKKGRKERDGGETRTTIER